MMTGSLSLPTLPSITAVFKRLSEVNDGLPEMIDA